MKLLGQRAPLGRAATTFNFLVGVIGLLALSVATVARTREGLPPTPHASPALFLTFLALFVFARLLRFEIPPNITASLIVPMQLASIVLLGPVPTAWLALPAFFTEVMRERPLRGLSGARRTAMLGIIAFNLGMEALVTLTAGACWRAVQPDGVHVLDTSWRSLLALLLTLGAFKGMNELLMVAGHWLRGTAVREYLTGARSIVIIETLTLPLAALLVLIKDQMNLPAFYIFIVALLLAAVVVRSLTHAWAELSAANADLQRRVREIQTIAEIGRAISADIELDSLLATIRNRCEDLVTAHHFYIALHDERQQALRIALEVIQGEPQPPHEIPLGEGLTSHVIESRQPLLVRDLDVERDALPTPPLQVDDRPNRSWLGVPMIARGETVGAIVLQDKRANAYDDDDVRVLLSIATQAAISIKNARLHQEELARLRIEAENRELKALNAKKSDFVNMVAHQFRTPLTTVMGYANLLLERVQRSGTGDGGVRDLSRHLLTVHSESRRLAQMVEELLNLSRIRSGHLPLTMQTFDVNGVLRETLAAHELVGEERDHELVAECGHEEAAAAAGAGELRVVGDSNFVRQVIGNMVSNAVKYSPAGSRVTTRSRADGEEVIVEVVDEGPGVPDDCLERIFEEFYRAPGVTLDLPGTGLGLSICKGIVEAHGGRCWAEPRGAGTAFCFSLPRPSRPPVDAAAPAAAERADG